MALVFMVGFPGSGKTHWGQKLSSTYAYLWKDMDSEIVKEYHTEISTLFSQWGEDEFRIKEKEMLHRIGEQDHTTSTLIVTTGGGTPCFYDNMDYMLSKGNVVWIQCTPETLFQRLSQSKDRPLTQHLTHDQLRDYIEKKLEERSFFYSKAPHHVPEHTTLEALHHIINLPYPSK